MRRRALLQVTIRLTKLANINKEVKKLLTTFCEMMGIYYAYEEKRNPRQVLRLYNLALKHSLAVKAAITPPKTMTHRKLFGMYHQTMVL